MSVEDQKHLMETITARLGKPLLTEKSFRVPAAVAKIAAKYGAEFVPTGFRHEVGIYKAGDVIARGGKGLTSPGEQRVFWLKGDVPEAREIEKEVARHYGLKPSPEQASKAKRNNATTIVVTELGDK